MDIGKLKLSDVVGKHGSKEPFKKDIWRATYGAWGINLQM